MAGIAAAQVSAVRAFNRFYTREIGVLREGLHGSPFTLAQGRVLYELGQGDATARVLASRLLLDAGYLSRMLRDFESDALIARTTASGDRRERVVTLTASGRAAFRTIDAASRSEIGAMLARIPASSRKRLTQSMNAIERLLGTDAPAPVATLRPHGPGDWGFIVMHHGALYAREFGFDARFEALVAGIVARAAANFDPQRERCWIAELDGERVGSVCVLQKSATVAQLRLLLVDPVARGHGLGERLVGECTAFARAAGYRSIVLWTQRNLASARRIYRAAGFVRVGSEPNHDFGKKLVAENWALDLAR